MVNEPLGNLEDSLAKPSSQTHKQTSIVSIFIGDFLSQKEGFYFYTCTQYTVNQALCIE